MTMVCSGPVGIYRGGPVAPDIADVADGSDGGTPSMPGGDREGTNGAMLVRGPGGVA